MVRDPDPRLTTPSRGLRSSTPWRRHLPAPSDALRRGPFAPGAFPSSLRSERLSAWLGVWLGIAFAVCFVTGLISHAIQQPPDWFAWPTRPVHLYRLTQGLHVAAGLAAVPLLLAKLWAVYPRLFTWPPARDVAHAVSRFAVLVLVASTVFQLASGLLNIARWYAPLGFFFTAAHHWTGWIAAGALLIHIGAQLDVLRRALRREARNGAPATDVEAPHAPREAADEAADEAAPNPQEPVGHTGGLTRRGLLATAGAAVAVVTVATAGQTVAPLAPVSLLAPRRPGVGSQGLPVNKSALAAGVTEAARDPAYRLAVEGPRPLRLSLTELAAMPQHSGDLPIACVEGWSADARWAGVRIRDLLDAAGVDSDAEIRVESLQRGGLYRVSVLPASFARDPLTLLALRLNGGVLDLDHGYPCRLIAPNRPGVLQTKWVAVLSPLGPGR